MRPTRTDSESEDDFQTPSRPKNHTDYSLDYSNPTRASTRIVNPNEPSTSRAAATAAKRQQTSKTTHQRERNPREQSVTHSSPERRLTRNNAQQSTTAQTRNRQRQTQQSATQRRKQRNPLSAAQRMDREIRYLQSKAGFLMQRAPFARLVREIMMDCGTGEVSKIMSSALETLQETAEMYITQVLGDAYMLTLHRQRVTLMPKDIQLLRLIKLLD